MKRVKVSITVPVYKVEKDLARCIESLINQSLRDIEIILVDDGSPDRCGEICDKYASIDSRIKVIHKENGGLASARQAGLNAIKGEYYTVCDSDDWIEPNAYETLYNFAKETDADIVLSDYYNNYPDGKQTRSCDYTFTSQSQYIHDLMMHKASVNTWCKLFKLSTIRELGIDYTQGINQGEDSLFLFKLLRTPLKICSINKAFYHYQRDISGNSYTNNITVGSVKQIEYIYNWRLNNYSDNSYHKANQVALINLSFAALRAKDINKEYYKSIIKRVHIRNIISNHIINAKSLLIIFTKIFGLRIGKLAIKCLYSTFYK